MKEKKEYIKPELVAVTFRLERGYAVSTPIDAVFTLEDEPQMEDYNTANDWTSGTGNFWS